MIDVTIRAGQEADHAFILQTWLRSYSPGDVSRDVYHRHHHELISRALDGEVWIAGPAGDSATILGYAVLSGQCLHFCYVKGPLRRFGVATSLLAGRQISEYSHRTNLGAHLVREGWIYNPYRFTGG